MKAKPKKQTDAQLLLARHLKELGMETIPEHMFCERQWRIDLYAPNENLGFEVHGGQYRGGHRTAFWGKKRAAQRRQQGLKDTPQEDEYLKTNTAQIYGIRLFQFSNEQVLDGRAKAFIAKFMDDTTAKCWCGQIAQHTHEGDTIQ